MKEGPRSTERLLLSASEASRSLGICERSLWQLTKDFALPCVRIKRRVLYDPRDLTAFIEQQKAKGPGAEEDAA